MGDEILPSYIGIIIINHDTDPYEPISKWNATKVLKVAQLSYKPGTVEQVPSFQQHIQVVARFSPPSSLCLVVGELGSLTMI